MSLLSAKTVLWAALISGVILALVARPTIALFATSLTWPAKLRPGTASMSTSTGCPSTTLTTSVSSTSKTMVSPD